MKKILLFLLIMLGLNITVSATETPINVIYIHGANQGKMGGLDGFTEWVNRMHPDLKKNFEKSDFIKSHLLSDTYIKEQPDILYWAHMLRENKSLIDYGLEKSKKNSNAILQFIRDLIGQNVHDAVWLQKNKNMTPILDKLNDKVLANYKKGEKTMLVGYSAGTFITLHYVLIRTPVINICDLYKQFKNQENITEEDVLFVEKYANQNTCVFAAIKSKLFLVDSEGVLHLNPNKKQREEALKRISQDTSLVCAPEDAISGVLNFGSPIVVFYSELSEANALNKYILAKSMQNIVETNKFYLTVNYAIDPIAMPIPDFTYEELLTNQYCKNIKNGNGFIYDTIIKGGKAITDGHRQYWFRTKSYTKAVVKAYENGYKYFYNK